MRAERGDVRKPKCKESKAGNNASKAPLSDKEADGSLRENPCSGTKISSMWRSGTGATESAQEKLLVDTVTPERAFSGRNVVRSTLRKLNAGESVPRR